MPRTIHPDESGESRHDIDRQRLQATTRSNVREVFSDAYTIKHTIEQALHAPRVVVERHTHRIDQHNDFYTTNADIFDSIRTREELRFPHQALQHEEKAIQEKNPALRERDAATRACDEMLESLAYWTIYYHPAIEDVEAAIRCNLTPFYYKETFYLAIGGCGTDLTPKLDAYQMLTTGSIPEDSHALRHPDYFRGVVGPALAEEALANCKRSTSRVIISYDESIENDPDHTSS